jgi:hypothetical protein
MTPSTGVFDFASFISGLLSPSIAARAADASGF